MRPVCSGGGVVAAAFFLYGGARADRFEFLFEGGKFGLGSDRIFGFTPDSDKLVIDSRLGPLDNAAEFRTFAKQVGDDVQITINDESTVTLVGVNLATLSSRDFVFV